MNPRFAITHVHLWIFIVIDFVAIDKETNVAYMIPEGCQYLYHEYDETKENILFSTLRHDKEIKPGSITDSGWIVEK